LKVNGDKRERNILGFWVVQLHGDRVEQYWSLSVHFSAVPSLIYKYYISEGNGLLTTHGITVQCDWFCIILFCVCECITYTSHLGNFVLYFMLMIDCEDLDCYSTFQF